MRNGTTVNTGQETVRSVPSGPNPTAASTSRRDARFAIDPGTVPTVPAGSRARLTKRAVEALRSPAEGSVFVWDIEPPGFGVRVLDSGVKTFVFQYRVKNRHVGALGARQRQQRRMKLGRFHVDGTAAEGALTVDAARSLARRLLAEVEAGGDPAGERRALAVADRDAPSIGDLAREYLEQHADRHKKLSSAKEDRRILAVHVLPALAATKVRDATTAELARLVHGLKATPVMANRVRALLSKMFALAMKWKWLSTEINPVAAVDRYREKKRQRFLTADELRRLGVVLAEAERDATEPWQAIAAVRLLLLTGCRRSEILTLQWTWIDRERGMIHLPDSKTGAKAVYLSAPAMAVLDALPKRGRQRYVLSSARRRTAPFVGIGHIWERLAKRAGLEGVRLHDLRHTFASFGAGLNAGLPMIGALLGHANPSTTARYAHLAADPVRQLNDRIGGALEGALVGITR